MKPCSCCGSDVPKNPWITGVWCLADGHTPSAVAYRCTCGNNRDIPWAEATDAQRHQANLAQASLDAASEMMMPGLF